MNTVQIIAVALFVLGYAAITLEHRLRTHKSAVGLALAGVLWLIATRMPGRNSEELKHAIEVAGSEVFGLVVFLLAAMTLVEVLIHFRLFDAIQVRLSKYGLHARHQFLLLAVITFFLSAILDNLTVTIIMIQISRRFYKGSLMIPVTAGIVVAANAGGAWSPIGDVTTILLWIEEKFTATEIIKDGFLPSVALATVACGLIARHVKPKPLQIEQSARVSITGINRIVVGLALGSFMLPVVMNFIGLPPYLGLLLGLGAVWLVIEVFQHPSLKRIDEETKLEAMLSKTDISSIKFFIGVLLAVSALSYMGVLDIVSHELFGAEPSFGRLVAGISSLGLLSAIVDNVPLTALAIDLLKVQDPALWVFLAVMVGTGGSALIIGSASGVVAMGMVKEINFGNYMKIATIPVLLGYAAAIAVWYAQYSLF